MSPSLVTSSLRGLPGPRAPAAWLESSAVFLRVWFQDGDVSSSLFGWGSQAFLFTAGSGTLRGAACWLVSCPTERGNVGCSTLTLSEASQAAASDSGLCLNIRPRKGRGVGGPSSALSRNHVSVAHLHKFLGPSTGSRAPSGDGPLLAMLLKATSQA